MNHKKRKRVGKLHPMAKFFRTTSSFKKNPFSKAQLVAFILTFGSIGGYLLLHSFAAGTTANLWIDTTGGTCTRQATAGAYNDAQACSSMQAAIAACTAGDTIIMKAGTYPTAQTITTTKTSPCPITGETGTTVTKIWTQASNLSISGVTATGGWECGVTGLNNITMTNVIFQSQVWLSGCGTNITMKGGRITGVNDGGAPTAVVIQGTSSSVSIANVTFDGVEFDSNDCSSVSANHYEVFRVNGYSSNVTLKNSYFHNNGVNSSQVFISSNGSGHTPGPITIEGNYFAPPVAPSGCNQTAAFFQINANLEGGSCPDLTIDYNTSQSSLSTIWDAGGANCSTPQSNIKFKGNISPRSAGNCGANTWDHNLWINSSSSNCGTGDQTVASTAAAGLTGDGFHITGTSPAINAGDPAACPSQDRDGDTRPQGGVCDIGADEFLSGGGGGDTQAPTAPTNLTSTASTATSITVSWTASTDNVGVTGYDLYKNSVATTTTTSTSATFSALSCGTSYTLGVDAFDAAGNKSSQTSGSFSTSACSGDTTPPTVPTNTAQTGSTTTSITLSWTASTDNVAVTGYRIYKNGAVDGTTASTSYTLSGLTCGTTYTVGLTAFDAAGNESNVALDQGPMSTAACGVIGDLNGDGHVTILDLSILLTHYGQAATASQGDINTDGTVTILDLSILLSHYGS